MVISFLLTLLVLGGNGASPLDSYSTVLQSAECGGDAVTEVKIQLHETVSFSSSYLTELNNGALPQDCEIHWRIAIENTHPIENWGIEVQGTVALEDPDNAGHSCASSLVKITDEDADGDLASVTEVFCGTQTVEFVTYEDSVNIILKTSSSAVTGQGFVLSFKPVNGCGGELTGAAGDVMTIASPGYPRPYTKDVSCMWDLTVPENSKVTLLCSKFRIMVRRPAKVPGELGECLESLRISNSGTFSHFCGNELNGNKKAKQWTGIEHIDFYFRSYSQAFGWPGFTCEISIE